SFTVKIQSLPLLFRLAADFENETKRHAATLSISYIDGLYKKKERLLSMPMEESDSSWFQDFHVTELKARVERGNQRLLNVRQRLSTQIDEPHFKFLTTEIEKNLTVKDFTKWNWEMVMEYVQGPLISNPRRLEEVVKNTKILKRLLSFFRPTRNQYADILLRRRRSSKYTKMGGILLRILSSSAEGGRFLLEHKFLSELVDALNQLDP
ncbi:hypothetical protein HDU76_011362, partial [Blyttiomyces sp. JEL0837]